MVELVDGGLVEEEKWFDARGGFCVRALRDAAS